MSCEFPSMNEETVSLFSLVPRPTLNVEGVWYMYIYMERLLWCTGYNKSCCLRVGYRQMIVSLPWPY